MDEEIYFFDNLLESGGQNNKDSVIQAWNSLPLYLQDENSAKIPHLIINLHAITKKHQFIDIYPELMHIFPQLIQYYDKCLYTIIEILKTAYNRDPLELFPIIEQFHKDSLVRLHLEGLFFNIYSGNDKNYLLPPYIKKFTSKMTILSQQDIEILTDNICNFLRYKSEILDKFYIQTIRPIFLNSKYHDPKYKDFVRSFWTNICIADDTSVFLNDLSYIIANSENIDEVCLTRMISTIDYWLQFEFGIIEDYGREFNEELLKFYLDSYDRIRNSVGIDQEDQIPMEGIIQCFQNNWFDNNANSTIQYIYNFATDLRDESKLSNEGYVLLMIYLFIHYYQYSTIDANNELFSMSSLYKFFFSEDCFNIIIDENNVDILDVFRNLMELTQIYLYQVPEEQIMEAALIVLKELQEKQNSFLFTIFHYLCKSHCRKILDLVIELFDQFNDAISYFEILLEAVKYVYVDETKYQEFFEHFYEIIQYAYENNTIEFNLHLFKCLSILYRKSFDEDILVKCNEYMNECLSLYEDMTYDDFKIYVSIINSLIAIDFPISDEIFQQIFEIIKESDDYNDHNELFKFYYYIKCDQMVEADKIYKSFVSFSYPYKIYMIAKDFINDKSHPFDIYSDFQGDNDPVLRMKFANIYSHYINMRERNCIQDTSLILNDQIDDSANITWIAMFLMKVAFPYLQLMYELGNNENFLEFMGESDSQFYFDELEECIANIMSSNINLLNYGVNIGFTIKDSNHCGVIARNIMNGQTEINLEDIEDSEESFVYSLKVVLFAVSDQVSKEEFLEIINMFPFTRFNNIFLDSLHFAFCHCDDVSIKESINVVVNRARILCHTILHDEFDIEKINALFPQ